MTTFLPQLEALLRERRTADPATSYTAALLADEDEIVKKIGEEAIEIILAAKSQGNERLVEECADLVYHLLVLLVSRDLQWTAIEEALARRRK